MAILAASLFVTAAGVAWIIGSPMTAIRIYSGLLLTGLATVAVVSIGDCTGRGSTAGVLMAASALLLMAAKALFLW